MAAQLHPGANHHVSPDVRCFADHSRRIDDRRRMDTGRVSWWLIEKAERVREGQIGVLETQRGRFNLRKLWLDQHGRRPGLARQSSILGIGHEGYFRWPCLLNPSYARNFPLRISAQLRTQFRCQLA